MTAQPEADQGFPGSTRRCPLGPAANPLISGRSGGGAAAQGRFSIVLRPQARREAASDPTVVPNHGVPPRITPAGSAAYGGRPLPRLPPQLSASPHRSHCDTLKSPGWWSTGPSTRDGRMKNLGASGLALFKGLCNPGNRSAFPFCAISTLAFLKSLQPAAPRRRGEANPAALWPIARRLSGHGGPPTCTSHR